MPYLEDDKILLRRGDDSTAIAKNVSAVSMLITEDGAIAGIALEIGTFARWQLLEIADLSQPRRLWARLTSMGVKLRDRSDTIPILQKFLLREARRHRRLLVSREGYHRMPDGNGGVAEFFQIGQQTFGTIQTGVESVVLSPSITSTYEAAGSLSAWQGLIAAGCVGNAIPTAALCAGMSAAVNALTGDANVSTAFVADTTVGKSTTLSIVQSMCQRARPLQTWGATGKGLLAFAAGHPHRPSVIDELGLADSPKDALRLIYAVGDHANRMRDRGDGHLRLDSPIETVLAIGGELALSDFALDAAIRAGSGYAVRTLTIPCDERYGCFSNLQGAGSPEEFAEDRLEAAMASHYGKFWPAFISKLFEDVDRVRRWHHEHFGKIREQLDSKAGGRHKAAVQKRIVKGAATWAFAGRVAVKFGLVPWDTSWPVDAVGQCLAKLFDSMDAGASPAGARIVAAIRRTLETERHRRFVPLLRYDAPAQSGALAGYSHRFRDGTRAFLFLRTVFEQEYFSKFGKQAALAALRNAGFLLPGEHDAPTKEVRLPNTAGEKARFYVIRESILFD